MIIQESVKNELKKPLGRLIRLEELEKAAKGKRIISVGDICTLNLISIGIMPHLAVFDYFYMRKKLDAASAKILKETFQNPKEYKNLQGTLADEIISDARKLLDSGGAVVIEGEEDLTALAFILAASENESVVYGQPNEGIVMVVPNDEIKGKIRKWLAVAAF
jgi:uncharacterized protein (UPF0218 family)